MTTPPSPCHHAETTTLLWLYGEIDDQHAAHVASCPDCSEVARLHADVLSLAAPSLRETPEPLAGRPLVEVSKGGEGVSLGWTLGALAVAATVLLAIGVVWMGSVESPSEPAVVRAPHPSASEVARLLVEDARDLEAASFDDLEDLSDNLEELSDDLDWLEESLASL
ncbi:MAG: hypothetical protein EA397_13085 [Deltaproteobacteria bacterium]|nr:MAG: hypothetical protein EA397_13085 [Deltaproteobacteria bacterium]